MVTLLFQLRQQLQGRMAANNAGTVGFSNKVKEFTLRNCNGIEIGLLNYGATVTSVRTPDRYVVMNLTSNREVG